MIKRFQKFLFSCLFICSGCTSLHLQQERAELLYESGDLLNAEEELSRTIAAQEYHECKDAVWLLLDRGTTRFAQGNIKGAIEDYQKAIEALDYYNQNSFAEQLAKGLLDDSAGAYQAPFFEQLLARVYFSLALLHQGDFGNAAALLRQAEGLQQEQQAIYSQTPITRHFVVYEDPFAKYLLALLLEKKGDASNAQILYQQAEQLANQTVRKEESGSATLLFVCHNGNSPYKMTEYSEASVASAAALEFFLALHQCDPAISTMTGIPVPVLVQRRSSFPIPTSITVDNIIKTMTPYDNIANTAALSLEQEKPIIVARGIVRLASRRAAVGYFQNQDPCLGALADLGMLIINSNTLADTRSWRSLPSSIDIARYDLPPGTHTITLQIGCRLFPEQYEIELKDNELCVVNIFNIHPGITTVQIPITKR